MPRRVLKGTVVGDKADKTISVLVERRFMHPVYKKYMKKSKRFSAHDENNQFKEGQTVSIIECRPISKSKSWTVLVDGKEPAPVAKKAEAPKKVEKKLAPKAEKDVKEASAKKETKKAPAKKAAPKKTAVKKTPAKKDTKAKKDKE